MVINTQVMTQISDVELIRGKKGFLGHFLPKRKSTGMWAIRSVHEDYLKDENIPLVSKLEMTVIKWGLFFLVNHLFTFLPRHVGQWPPWAAVCLQRGLSSRLEADCVDRAWLLESSWAVNAVGTPPLPAPLPPPRALSEWVELEAAVMVPKCLEALEPYRTLGCSFAQEAWERPRD